MKIAYVVINANRREGTSRAVLEVAERLARKHQVDLVSRTAENVDLSQVHWRKVPGPSWPEVCDFTSFVVLADYLLSKGGYDIIHSAGPNCSAADVYTVQTVQSVKRRVMRELDAHQGASAPRRLTRALYDRAVLRVERLAYRSNNHRGRIAYLPVSSGARAELLDEYPVAGGLVEVIPNGADLEKFKPSNSVSQRQKIRQRHGLALEDFVLVFSGGDWARKGLKFAAEAVAMINNPKIKLLVVGSDPLQKEFCKSLESLDLNNRICFAGFQTEVEDYYAAADAFVFPTAYEAFSLATIEAAASGLPVLMSNVSGAEELVGDGRAGEIVERTSEAFAAAIERLANHPERCRQMGRAGRQIVEQRFCWDVIAESTERVYEKLLANRRLVIEAGSNRETQTA